MFHFQLRNKDEIYQFIDFLNNFCFRFTFNMCFQYWFFFLILLFYAFNHCAFASLFICFFMKFMIILFLILTVASFCATLLINWFTFSFSIIFLQLDIHCMWIWHWFWRWFWRKLIKFCHMSLNNFELTLFFIFSFCNVIWLFIYTQILLLNSHTMNVELQKHYWKQKSKSIDQKHSTKKCNDQYQKKNNHRIH